MNNIYLIGFMGAGKTAVAKALEKKTSHMRYDTDDMIVEREKQSISDIFEKKGEAHFRQVEMEVVASLSKKKDCIVSCGGGVIKSKENIAELKKGGTVVFLAASPEIILERVLRNNRRPLLEGKKNLKDITAMLNERMPLYERAYDLRIFVDGKTPDEIAEEIIDKTDMLH